MNFNQLAAEILKVLPNASFGEDNDGQIIVYTNLAQTNSDNDKPLVDMGEQA